MKKENLFCLSCINLAKLDTLQINEAPEGLEIDIENTRWRNKLQRRGIDGKVEEGEWNEIGTPGFGVGDSNCDVRFVFDISNVDHIKKAIKVTADFHR